MPAYVLRRIGTGVVTLLLVTMITFGLMSAAPGGPAAIVSMTTTASQRAALTKEYGLNEPVPVRYVLWLEHAVTGNLGVSFDYSEPVTTVLEQRFPNTALLAVTALTLSVLAGIPLGVAAARRRGSALDALVTGLSTVGLSIPDFWLGTLFIILFAVTLRWLPVSGMTTVGQNFSFVDLLSHLAMPASVLSLAVLPNIVRFTRSSMATVLDLEYIRTAHAKGLTPTRVLLGHALKNALIPVVSTIGLLVPALLGGSVIVENVFAWPGMGRLAVQAATDRDYPMVMGVTLVAGIIVITTNLVVDLLYTVLDPRIQYG
jgi:peptide/nickel transport system permease protein